MMMNGAPKISVIIPVYNAEKYLRQCLDSVINQTLQNIEIICVDDGSTDCSSEILLEYSKKDVRINVLTQENHGQSAARNNALSVAAGEYVAFLDSDDFYVENALAELYTLAQSETADIIGFNAFPLFENKNLEMRFQAWKTYYARKQIINQPISGPAAMNLLTQNSEYRPSACLLFYRRGFLEEHHIRFYDGIIHEDNLFTFQCFVLAKRVMQVSEQYYGRRAREDSTMTQVESVKNLRGYFLCLINMLRSLKNIEMTEDEEESLKKNIASIWYAVQRLHKELPQDEIWDLLQCASLEERVLFDLYLKLFPPKTVRPGSEIKVSVVVPIYNAERYIWDCLDSVLAQTLEDIEVICVDDGSTDSTPSILALYAKQDKRVKIVTQQNLYAGVARNRGIQEAKGKYIYFLDADDFIDKDLLEDAYLSAEQVGADIVLSPMDIYDSLAHVFLPMAWSLSLNRLPNKRPFAASDLPKDIFMLTTPGPSNKFFLRDFVIRENLQFADTRRSEDVCFVLPALAFANRVTTTATLRPRYHYRKNVSTSLETSKTVADLPFWRNYLLAKKRLEEHGIYEDLKIAFVNCALSSCLYELDTHNNYEDYIELHNRLKKEIFQSLDICNVEASDFSIEQHYKRFLDIMHKEPAQKDFADSHLKKTQNVINNLSLVEQPLVSVIIPVYNSERFLWECLDSLRLQTMAEIEIICVDDGSSDQSMYVLQECQKLDPRIKIISQENQYAGVARNNGLRYAKGEYVIFLDADDFFDADMLRSLYGRAKAYKADICVCRAKRFWQTDKRIEMMPWICKTDMCPKNKAVFSKKDMEKSIFQFTTPAPWSKLYRREFVLANNLQFQAIRTANDVAFVMTSLALAERITVLEQYLLFYRTGVPTTLQATKAKEPLMFLESLRCLKNNLINHNVYNDVQISFANMALDVCLYNLRSVYSPLSHKKVYQYLQNTAFYELDITSLKDWQADNKKNYSEYQQIITLSWEEYVKVKGLFQATKAAPPQPVGNVNNDYYYQEIQRIYASKSFRIGRFVTYIPRKVRGGIRCYKEHGMGYTMRRVKEKFVGLLGGSKQ